MKSLTEVFKAYDVRGLVPEQLDAAMCRAVGSSFARFAAASRMVVARDMRQSGVELSRAFMEGAAAEGAHVIDLGLASTDLLYFASGHLDAPGAMFTASHNPAAYNGIKMCRAGALPVGEDTGLDRIRAGAQALLDRPVPDGERGPDPGGIEPMDLLAAFATHVRSFVDPTVLKPLRVVADTANGMGGLVVPEVFAGLGFDLEILFGELDGAFPNHPADPIQAENLVALQDRVASRGADVGLAFDGDADRVFLVDEESVGLSGSVTTAMVAKAVLAKKP
ncbi:MAG: phosphomannomutase/phosphoglucomutase, partial [Acidimicrobiales bacterium]